MAIKIQHKVLQKDPRNANQYLNTIIEAKCIFYSTLDCCTPLSCALRQSEVRKHTVCRGLRDQLLSGKLRFWRRVSATTLVQKTSFSCFWSALSLLKTLTVLGHDGSVFLIIHQGVQGTAAQSNTLAGIDANKTAHDAIPHITGFRVVIISLLLAWGNSTGLKLSNSKG